MNIYPKGPDIISGITILAIGLVIAGENTFRGFVIFCICCILAMYVFLRKFKA